MPTPLKSGAAVAAILAQILAAPLATAADECRDARRDYKEALQSLSRALHVYTQCLDLAKGESDCAVEFVDVESAQRDIEAAVARISDECR